MLNVAVASFSVSGDDRPNDDAISFLPLGSDGYLLAIADGVGSAKHGGDAAKLAVTVCHDVGDALELPALFSEVCNRIRAETSEVDYKQWSSTLTVCRVFKNAAQVGHVGDTRIYHLRGNGLQTRTKDQTEVARLIDEGVLSRERALRYPRKNVLLSTVNPSADFDLQISDFSLESGDRILLLSDGVYSQISKSEIVSVSRAHRRVNDFIESLRTLLFSKGLVDDASAICAEIVIV